MHPYNQKCYAFKEYSGGEERSLRSKYVWTQKSIEIREKANYLCEVCRDSGIYNHESLEVHHIEKLKDNKDLYLENENLVLLCTEHHKLADKNQIDKDYLRSLAIKRESKS